MSMSTLASDLNAHVVVDVLSTYYLDSSQVVCSPDARCFVLAFIVIIIIIIVTAVDRRTIKQNMMKISSEILIRAKYHDNDSLMVTPSFRI